jgi:hypothetical protein
MSFNIEVKGTSRATALLAFDEKADAQAAHMPQGGEISKVVRDLVGSIPDHGYNSFRIHAYGHVSNSLDNPGSALVSVSYSTDSSGA